MTPKNKYGPVFAFGLTYLVLIILGALILMMPGMATRPLSSLEALFTTVSAVTLTGLQLFNFAAIFTDQGQYAVLGLIQCGAIAIVSFSLYFGWLMGKGFIFSDDESLLNQDISPMQAYLKILKKTCTFLFFFELISIIILFAFWTGDISYSPAQKFHYAFFNGVSVFCHAGFSNLEGNFSNPHVSHSYILMLALTGVMVLGAIGYAAMFDLISLKRLRRRMAEPAKNWNLQTRIALFSTLIIITGGSIFWFVTEQHHALQGHKLVESAFMAMFNVAGASAGFYSVDIYMLGPVIAGLYMVLMFFGGSAGSTSGGLKTSILYAAIFSPKNISRTNARLTGMFIVSVLLMSLLVVSSTDMGISSRSLKFETLSAFTNSGISFGITPNLSLAGKYVLIFDMIAGRVGLPIIIYLLLRKRPEMGRDILMI